MTSKDVEDLKSELAEAYSAATANQYLKLLKSAYNRAIRLGTLTHNPVTAVRLYRENNARNRCLTPEEELRLLEALPDRVRPLVIVALHTGMRRGEPRALKWEDVDFATNSLRIRRDKAGDGRWVALNSTAREGLLAAKREQKVLSNYVFCSPQESFFITSSATGDRHSGRLEFLTSDFTIVDTPSRHGSPWQESTYTPCRRRAAGRLKAWSRGMRA